LFYSGYCRQVRVSSRSGLGVFCLQQQGDRVRWPLPTNYLIPGSHKKMDFGGMSENSFWGLSQVSCGLEFPTFPLNWGIVFWCGLWLGVGVLGLSSVWSGDGNCTRGGFRGAGRAGDAAGTVHCFAQGKAECCPSLCSGCCATLSASTMALQRRRPERKTERPADGGPGLGRGQVDQGLQCEGDLCWESCWHLETGPKC
jgi:hypothetical protein